ncbi:glutaredoxin-like protein [Thermoplasmatales archaeon SCGC AB-539-C06]|nr:glutaredoxin-like protein [Thermoplasmatales archaeon SCGC AB-539-C06]
MKCKIFTTPMCPKCNALKESMKEEKIEVEVVDATTPEGLEQARKYQVSSVPTVLFFDEKEEIVSTAHNFEEVKRVVDNKSLTDVK